MTNLELASLMASIASIILAVIAIWLALYFYHKSKQTEKIVALDLTEIKTQAGTLERLTGRWMDRFTRYAVNPKPADETTTLLMSIVERSIPPTSAELKQIRESDSPENLIAELITCYILIHNYASISNIATQGYLPEEISQIVGVTKIKELVDGSFTTFQHLDQIIEGLDQTKLQGNVLYATYCETITNYKHLVKDTTTYYAEKNISL